MTDQNPAPEATQDPQTAPDTQPAPVDPAAELEALRAKYERAQADLNKFRTRADEVEAARKAAEEKALAEADAVKKAELLAKKVAELEAASAEAAARATAAERKAALAGKVNDLDLALAVASKYATDDGSVDVDALLAAHPSLAPGKTPTQASTPGAGGNIASRQTQLASLQDQLKNAKSMAERVSLQRQIHELQKG